MHGWVGGCVDECMDGYEVKVTHISFQDIQFLEINVSTSVLSTSQFFLSNNYKSEE
jgi:hypothetical protein